MTTKIADQRSRASASTRLGTHERAEIGGSAMKAASSPSADRRPRRRLPQAVSTRADGSATLVMSRPSVRARGRCSAQDDHVRPTNSTTRPWIRSVRFDASSGWKISGSRFRVDVPVRSAPKRSAARPDADRRVAAEQRDRDADEADLRRLDVAGREPELPAEDVDRAREAGERAGDRHREEVVARDVDAAVARRLGVEADGLDAVAERRPVEDDPVDDERADRDEEADVEALEQRVAPEDGELRALEDVVRDRDERPACRSGAGRRGRTGTRRPRSTIQLSMIVEITSCAPTVALRKPAMPATSRARSRRR